MVVRIVVGEYRKPYSDEPETVGPAGQMVLFFSVANNNLRPKIPDRVPPEITKLMVESWHGDPAARPTMEELMKYVEDARLTWEESKRTANEWFQIRYIGNSEPVTRKPRGSHGGTELELPNESVKALISRRGTLLPKQESGNPSPRAASPTREGVPLRESFAPGAHREHTALKEPALKESASKDPSKELPKETTQYHPSARDNLNPRDLLPIAVPIIVDEPEKKLKHKLGKKFKDKSQEGSDQSPSGTPGKKRTKSRGEAAGEMRNSGSGKT